MCFKIFLICTILTSVPVIQFNFLESRIMKHAKAFAVSGIYEEPVDPTVASQVIYPRIGYLFFSYCQYIRHLMFML